MVNKICTILLSLVVTACSTTPRIKIETQEVLIPVPTACKVEDPIPPGVEFDKLTVEDNLDKKVKALLADRLRSIGYQTELVVALKSCR